MSILQFDSHKDSQMPHYFVEVRVIFKDGLSVVKEMLREPTLKIPKFIKVSKKNLIYSCSRQIRKLSSLLRGS